MLIDTIGRKKTDNGYNPRSGQRLLEDTGLAGSDDIRHRLDRLQKDLEAIKKERADAQEQLTDIGDTLERLQSGQTKHKQELDEEQKRQDDKKRKTQ
jgi:predicted  nucleic acid-binding Zn-ribbon protein